MTALSDYRATTRRLATLDAELNAAIDKLLAARRDRRAEDVTPLRLKCGELEKATDEALFVASAAHCRYWRERARALRTEIVSASLTAMVKLSHAARLSGDGLPQGFGTFGHDVGMAPEPAPGDLGEIPAKAPEAPSLDRADEEV